MPCRPCSTQAAITCSGDNARKVIETRPGRSMAGFQERGSGQEQGQDVRRPKGRRMRSVEGPPHPHPTRPRHAAHPGGKTRRPGFSYNPQPPTPEWRNWQTRWIQNPLTFGSCGFESHLRYSADFGCLAGAAPGTHAARRVGLLRKPPWGCLRRPPCDRRTLPRRHRAIHPKPAPFAHTRRPVPAISRGLCVRVVDTGALDFFFRTQLLFAARPRRTWRVFDDRY